MRLVVLLLVCLLPGCAGGSGGEPSSGPSHSTLPSAAENYAFLNGRWFDGKGFEAVTWY